MVNPLHLADTIDDTETEVLAILRETLGYDPEYMRAGLCRWKEAALERSGTKPQANPLAG